MTLDDDDIRLLTWQARRCRPHGARRWDEPGIAAALQKVRHLELAEVMMAVARAARDRTLDTPAAIGNTSAPCWIERPVERYVPEKLEVSNRCSTCGQSRERCETSPRFGDDDHTFEPDFRVRAGGAVDELRDIKAKATTTTEQETADA